MAAADEADAKGWPTYQDSGKGVEGDQTTDSYVRVGPQTAAQILADASADVAQYRLAISSCYTRQQARDTFALLEHAEWAADTAVSGFCPARYMQMAARCVWSVLPVLRGEDR